MLAIDSVENIWSMQKGRSLGQSALEQIVKKNLSEQRVLCATFKIYNLDEGENQFSQCGAVTEVSRVCPGVIRNPRRTSTLLLLHIKVAFTFRGGWAGSILLSISNWYWGVDFSMEKNRYVLSRRGRVQAGLIAFTPNTQFYGCVNC